MRGVAGKCSSHGNTHFADPRCDVEKLLVVMKSIDRLDDHTDAHPPPWSNVELIVDPQRSFDAETIVGEWRHANAGWSVSHVSPEQIVRRAMDILFSSASRSWLASRSDFAFDLGRFITLAADSRTVSVRQNHPPSDLSTNLEQRHGWIIFDERGISPLVIAVPADSVFCASTIRVATRLIEDRHDAAFSEIIEAAMSAARLLGADAPRLAREVKEDWSRTKSRSERRKPFGNGHSGGPGTRRRYLTQLALAETAAVIVNSAYL